MGEFEEPRFVKWFCLHCDRVRTHLIRTYLLEDEEGNIIKGLVNLQCSCGYVSAFISEFKKEKVKNNV